METGFTTAAYIVAAVLFILSRDFLANVCPVGVGKPLAALAPVVLHHPQLPRFGHD